MWEVLRIGVYLAWKGCGELSFLDTTSAGDGLRLGETVLLTLVILGETGLDKIDADTLNRVVVALRLVGLDREARELAIEAALANGV